MDGHGRYEAAKKAHLKQIRALYEAVPESLLGAASLRKNEARRSYSLKQLQESTPSAFKVSGLSKQKFAEECGIDYTKLRAILDSAEFDKKNSVHALTYTLREWEDTNGLEDPDRIRLFELSQEGLLKASRMREAARAVKALDQSHREKFRKGEIPIGTLLNMVSPEAEQEKSALESQREDFARRQHEREEALEEKRASEYYSPFERKKKEKETEAEWMERAVTEIERKANQLNVVTFSRIQLTEGPAAQRILQRIESAVQSLQAFLE